MIVTITKELDEEIWGHDLAGLTDEQIINLCLEDVTELMDRAHWKIERP